MSNASGSGTKNCSQNDMSVVVIGHLQTIYLYDSLTNQSQLMFNFFVSHSFVLILCLRLLIMIIALFWVYE